MKKQDLFIWALFLIVFNCFRSYADPCQSLLYIFNVGSGNWSSADSWLHEIWNEDLQQCVPVPGIPTSISYVQIHNGGMAVITDNASADIVDISYSGLDIISGSLYTNYIDVLGGSIGISGNADVISSLQLQMSDLNISGSLNADFIDVLGGTTTITGTADVMSFVIEPSHFNIGGSLIGNYVDVLGGTVSIYGSADISSPLNIQSSDVNVSENPTVGSVNLESCTFSISGNPFINSLSLEDTSLTIGGNCSLISNNISVNDLSEFGIEGGSASTDTLNIFETGVVSGGTLIADYEEIETSGIFTHNGGINTVNDSLTVLDPNTVYELLGTAELNAGIEKVHQGTFLQSGGTNTVNELSILSSDGTYELFGTGQLNAGLEDIHQGVFKQSQGTNTVCELSIGMSGGFGTYELFGNGTLIAGSEVVGESGSGIFKQTAGTNSITNTLHLGYYANSNGRYELSGPSQLTAMSEIIGLHGQSGGTFVQSGGINTVTGDIVLAYDPNSYGTYELSGSADLVAERAYIGLHGGGTFTQTGGTNTVTDLLIAWLPGSTGIYELPGGTLNVSGTVEVVMAGVGGIFTVDGGTINGTTEDAVLYVNGDTASLEGPGTFNIYVTYATNNIYGTDREESVYVTFEPNCLTVGGLYDVNQITPLDFADGGVPNLLPSSIFDVVFQEANHCGKFEIEIPYDIDELSCSEFNLKVYHETGPSTYEQLETLFINRDNHTITAKSYDFGQFAVAVDDCCVPWRNGDLDNDCDVDLDDLKKMTLHWLQDETLVDIAGADGIINLNDFSILSSSWLECTQ